MERTTREHEATLRQYERERLATPSVSGTAAAAARESAEREARGTGTGSPAARALGGDDNSTLAHHTAVHGACRAAACICSTQRFGRFGPALLC